MGPSSEQPAPIEPSLRPGRRIAWRRAVVLVLPILYVAGTAVETAEPSPRAWMAIVIGLVLAFLGSLSRAGETASQARARLWTTGALALTVASSALAERWAWVGFARELALIASTLAAVRAIAKIDGDPGLATRATEAVAPRGFGPAVLERTVTLLVIGVWGSAALVDALAFTGISPGLADTGAVAASAAGVVALGALGANALVAARRASSRARRSATRARLCCRRGDRARCSARDRDHHERACRRLGGAGLCHRGAGDREARALT